jgi:hypothetical protein
MEGVALPIQFDTVPIVPLAEFFDMREAVFTHFGDGKIPRESEPL